MFFSASHPLTPQARAGSWQGVVSRFGGHAVALLRRAGSKAWHGLEKAGEARANREMRQLADCWAITSPELARELRAAIERDVTTRGSASDNSAAGHQGDAS